MKSGGSKTEWTEKKKRDTKADAYRDGSGGSKAEKAEKSEPMEKKGVQKSGQSGKGSLTEVSPEQKSKVRAAFSRHRVAPVQNLGISVNVGAVVPRTIKFHRVPREIVILAPAYEYYLYFLIGDQICIVDPETYEIVDIIVIA